MNFKTTLFALAALIILAAIFVYVQFHKPPRHAAKPARQVFATALPKLKSLTIHRRNHQTLAFAQNKGVWWMTKPLHTTARAYRLTALASSLRRIKYIKKFRLSASGPHSPAATGLAHPSATVQFIDGRGHSHSLALGARRASGGLYARLLPNGRTLYVLHSQWRQRLTHPLAGYRSRQLATASASRIVALSIAHRKQTVNIHKVGKKWMIEQPITTLADAKVINHIVSNLTYLQANAFAHISPRAAGLTPPVVRVTLLEKPRAHPPVENPRPVIPTAKKPPAKPQPLQHIVVNFGHYTDLTRKFVYASRPGDPSVFTVGADIFKSVNKHLSGLRDSAVLPMALNGATSIRLGASAATPLVPANVSLLKIGAHWTMHAPLGHAMLTLPASARTIKALLHALHMLHANKFVDGAGNLSQIGLKPPVRTITLTLPGRSRAETLLVGRPQKAQPVTPVMLAGQPTVMLVQNGDLKGTDPNILSLRAHAIASWQAQSVQSIAIKQTGKPPLMLARQKKHWMANVGKAVPARANASDVTMLLGSIDPLTAKKWLATRPVKSAAKLLATVAIRSSAAPAAAGAAAMQKAMVGPQMAHAQTTTLQLFATGAPTKAKGVVKQPPAAPGRYMAQLSGEPLAGIPASAEDWAFVPQQSLVNELLHTQYAKPIKKAKPTASTAMPPKKSAIEPAKAPETSAAKAPPRPPALAPAKSVKK